MIQQTIKKSDKMAEFKGVLQMPFLYVQILMTLNFENRMEDVL